MRMSTVIKKARDQWDTLGWTSNAKRVEKDAAGNVTAVCAQEAIDRVTKPGRVRKAVTELLTQVSMMGIAPGHFNDLPGMTHDQVKEAFDIGYVFALEQEGCDIEKALAA